jgi:HEAT repeat protein
MRSKGRLASLGIWLSFSIALAMGIVAKVVDSTAQSNQIDKLIADLKSPDSDVRLHAWLTLGSVKDSAEIDAVVAALKDPNSDVRCAVASALGDIKAAKVVEPLIAALGDADSKVRACVARSLGNLKNPRATESLIAVLKDPDISVRQGAAESLAKIGTPAVEPLIAALKDWGTDAPAGIAAALRDIQDPRAIEPLVAVLTRGSGRNCLENPHNGERVCESQLQTTAIYALGRAGAPAVKPLIEVLNNADAEVRARAAEALGLIHPPAIEPLIGCLKDTSWGVRTRAGNALASIGQPAVEPLVAILHDPNVEIRRSAADALARMADSKVGMVPRALDALLGTLKELDLAVISEVLFTVFIHHPDTINRPDTEEALIETLNSKYGNKEMAEYFVNAGNERLKAAGTAWATEHGYTIVPRTVYIPAQ